MVFGILVVVLGAAFGSCGGNATIREHAEEDARAYTRTMHPGWARNIAVCQGSDSSGDGYVRCTIGDGNTTEDIECRTSLFFDYSRGCVPMRNTAPTRNR